MSHAITIRVTGSRPGRPPVTRLLAEVEVRNEATTERWVVLPTKLPVATGGVDKLEELTTAEPRYAIGRMLGTGGRYVLKLAPNARVTLRNLELTWWRETGAEGTFEVEVALAGKATVGGEPLDGWFAAPPMLTGTVAIDLDAAKHTASHRSGDGKEVALALDEVVRVPVSFTAP